jgi:anti-anti-sigma factor
MSISTSEDGSKVTIRVSGRFDFSTHQEFVKAYKSFEKNSKAFLVDLGGAEYMDSSAMGMLLQLREYSSNNQVDLVNANQGIKEILRIANFDRLFKVS